MNRIAFLLCVFGTSLTLSQEPGASNGDLSPATGSVESGGDAVGGSVVEPVTPSEPRSMPGVVTTVTDGDGNEYPVVAVQWLAIKLMVTQVPHTKYRTETRTRSLVSADGSATEQSYTVRVPYTEMVSVQRPVAGEQSRYLVPLSPSVTCFGLSGTYVSLSQVSDAGTNVLVTGTSEDARKIIAELREVAKKQLILTGLSLRLPSYVIALSGESQSVDAKSLSQLLREAAPFKGKVKFFGALKLEEQKQEAEPKPATPIGMNPRRDNYEVLSQAQVHFAARQYSQAEPLLTTLIQNKTRQPLAHYLRGLIRHSRGDWGGADLDFMSGAAVEAPGGYSAAICRDLETVQGPARIALEKHRRNPAS